MNADIEPLLDFPACPLGTEAAPAAAAASVDPPVDGPQSIPGKGKGGGRTERGRDRSKRNALNHGLYAQEVFPEPMAIAIARLKDVLTDEFQPAGEYQRRLVVELAISWAKLDECRVQQEVNRLRAIDQAGLCWESDQRGIIDKLGARLQKDCGRVSRALERTKQGVDWLLDRLDGLELAIANHGGLDEVQYGLLLDVLGVLIELRNGGHSVPARTDGPALAARVRAQIERLEALQETTLFDLDEARQDQAKAGLPYEADAEIKRLRRLEVTLKNDIRWAQEEIQRAKASAAAAAQARAREDQARKDREMEARCVIPRVKQAPPVATPHESPAETIAEIEIDSESESETPAPAVVLTSPTAAAPIVANAPASLRPGSETLAATLFLPNSGNRRSHKAAERALRKSAHRQAGSQGQ
jgi:hypothetical protein